MTENENNDLFLENVSIITDKDMGRCLISKNYISSSSIIFEDYSFLNANCEEENNEIEKKILKLLTKNNNNKTKLTLSKIQDFILDFSEYERVQSIDTSRCFLLGIAIALNPQTEKQREQIHQLSELQPANLEECIENVKLIRKQHKNIIPSTISNELAGRLLGILNNNQMELERYNGSGIFLKGCLCEHNCLPNSSYSTDYIKDSPIEDQKQKFTLVAIRDIQPGDRISIDYGNHFYHPLHVRQAHLQKVYNFTCTCSLCYIPTSNEISSSSSHTIHSPHLIDPFRSFYCLNPTCNGVINAIYTSSPSTENIFNNEDFLYTSLQPSKLSLNNDNNSNDDDDDIDDELFPQMNIFVGFKCNSCSWHTKNETEWKLFLSKEEEFCINSPETLTEYISWKSTNLIKINNEECKIHPNHYLVFWLEDNLVNISLGENDDHLNAIIILREMIERLNSFPSNIIPTILHEKVVYWDRLGQAAVVYADQLSNLNISNSKRTSLKRSNEGNIIENLDYDYDKVIELAQSSFLEGYKMSLLSCGEFSQTTQDLKKLAGLVEGYSTPRTLLELQTHYNNRT